MGEGEGDRQGALAGEYTNFQHCFRASQFDPQTHELALFETKMHAAMGVAFGFRPQGVRFMKRRL
jgi:hypothetical protein